MIWILCGMRCGRTGFDSSGTTTGNLHVASQTGGYLHTRSLHPRAAGTSGREMNVNTVHCTRNVTFCPDITEVCVSGSSGDCSRAESWQCVCRIYATGLLGVFHTNERTRMFQQEFFAYTLDTKRSHLSEDLSEHTGITDMHWDGLICTSLEI